MFEMINMVLETQGCVDSKLDICRLMQYRREPNMNDHHKRKISCKINVWPLTRENEIYTCVSLSECDIIQVSDA